MKLWRGPHAFKVNAWPLYLPYILAVGITLSVCLLQLLVWKDTRFYKTNAYEHISAQNHLYSKIMQGSSFVKMQGFLSILFAILLSDVVLHYRYKISLSLLLTYFHDVVKHQERLEYRLLIFRLNVKVKPLTLKNNLIITLC